MDRVAEDMQPEPAPVDAVAQLRPHGGDRDDDHEADHGAQRKDLHDRERAPQRADRYRHHAERQERAGHPQDHASQVHWVISRLLFGSAMDDQEVRRRPHSASGWFSGRALSKAGSLAQAASTATTLGKASSGTLSRRALATCGTTQMSATVTSAPKA